MDASFMNKNGGGLLTGAGGYGGEVLCGVVRSIAGLYKMKGIETQVLAASIRTPHRVVRSFYNGADVVTMPPKVFWGMYDHILTTDGLRIFDEDATKIVSSVGSSD